ncbi:MAG TPA: Stp1/IreP family PP2C-type Ser/Thr phosphatase [Acidiferrobacterales bacterium]
MSGLAMSGLTHPGQVRDRNEDAFLLEPANGIAVLADGMGGHQAGEVASAMAVDLITRHLREAADARAPGKPRPATALGDAAIDAIRSANQAIFDAARSKPEYAGMGTTVVVALFDANKLWVAHVGDSRLYRFRGGRLSQITVDHSMVQELLNRGLISEEEARTSANKNLVTRALGVDTQVEPDVQEQTFLKGDVYLLCSDGLTDVLPDADIERILQQHRDALDTAVQQLVDEANARGGPDNVSVVLVRTDKRFARDKQPSADATA